MSTHFLLITILIVTVCIVAGTFIPSQYKKTGIIITILLCSVLGGTLCVYILNTPFRQEINMIFNSATKHIYILDKQQNDIPLPPSTVFKYRSSDTLAAYVSKLSAGAISDFYSQLAENGAFLKEKENGAIKLLFKYHGENFVVIIDRGDNNSNFTINLAD